MQTVNWGIIGCGDVTEIKSGPAFNKVPNSRLVAVMRRDAAKAKDYAQRHHVPRWYSNADALINDAGVNAIYIATPPSSHEEYAIAAIRAGKPVYVEKPMALNFSTAQNMVNAAKAARIKLVVAHYRRQWPLFKKVKQLIAEKAIGEIRLARLEFYKPAVTKEELAIEKNAWRVNPAIAGGGLFHDLAPHQLDLMFHFFGEPQTITGIAANQGKIYSADDMVAGTVLFKNNIVFTGAWCFNAALTSDKCEIIGSKGTISFSFFNGNTIDVTRDDITTNYFFDTLQHVQQPMIQQVVQYFLGKAPNPCSGQNGAEIMRWMDEISAKE